MVRDVEDNEALHFQVFGEIIPGKGGWNEDKCNVMNLEYVGCLKDAETRAEEFRTSFQTTLDDNNKNSNYYYYYRILSWQMMERGYEGGS